MNQRLLRFAPWMAALVVVLPLALYANGLYATWDVRRNAPATAAILNSLTGERAETKIFIWYMRGCKPCLYELPLIYKLDSIGRATGKFSVTMMGLGADSTFEGDRQWKKIHMRKLAAGSHEKASYYASPTYHLEGRLDSPNEYPAYLLVRKGQMVRYHYGRSWSLDEVLPEGSGMKSIW